MQAVQRASCAPGFRFVWQKGDGMPRADGLLISQLEAASNTSMDEGGFAFVYKFAAGWN
jgi:hypothetical protein